MKPNKILIVFLLLLTGAVCSGAWPINFTNVDNPRLLESLLRDRIGTLDDTVAQIQARQSKGSGNYFYVDSGRANATAVDGKSLVKAEPTLEAVFAGGELTANNGDVIFMLQNHAENLTAADAADCDVAGVTIIGLGDGTDMPEFSYTETAGELVIGAANITIYNVRFIAATGSITMGISVEAAGDNFTLIGCVFPEPATSTWEFLDAVDLATTVNGFSCIGNIYYHTATTGPAHFIEAGNGTNHEMRIIGNEIQGQFSVAAIWSDTIDLRAYIAYNTIRQMTAGQHCIEFTTTALGIIERNTMYASSEENCLDPGSMYPIENYVCTAIDQTGVLVPATAGVKRYVSKAQTGVQSGTPNLFDVDGGPILITNFFGLVTTNIGATVTTVEIALDADSGWTDYDFSTAVAITSDAAGTRYVFESNVVGGTESVLTPCEGADAGATSQFESWYCGEGMIEAMASTADNTGAITWYMEYVPLAAGVTVTAQ